MGRVSGGNSRGSRAHQPYDRFGGRGGAAGGTRVYVGNLSYEVRWQSLKDHFKQAGDVVHADVMMEGDNRSKGCGIVEFSNADDAQHAIASLNDTELLGRLIFVREDREGSDGFNRGGAGGASRSRSPGRGGARGDRGGYNNSRPAVVTNGRVYVGNLAWDVTWQDLKDHFRTCGEVLHADVFMGSDGRSRGCGLVEFATNAEAAEAIARLNDLDFRGRPLHVREDRKQDDGGR